MIPRPRSLQGQWLINTRKTAVTCLGRRRTAERAFRHTRTVEIVCTLARSLRTLREHSTIPNASQATVARQTICAALTP
jgi:hypothetical protein